MDWVKTRLDCSLITVWRLLAERIKKDVERWRALTRSPVEIAIAETPDTNLVLSRGVDASGGMIEIISDGSVIIVRSQARQQLSAVITTRLYPGLSAKGECRIFTGDQELELWQVSRLVLEPLLFGPDQQETVR